MATISPKIFVTLILAAILAGCGSEDAATNSKVGADTVASNKRTVRVETREVGKSSFTDVIELTGDVEALDDVTLSSQTAGTIVYLAEPGARVREGGMVARIDPGIVDAGVEQAKARVDAARAQYDLALDTYKRQEPLFRDSVISALEFENVRTRLNQTEAELKQAQALQTQAEEQSRYTRITAPFNGSVETNMVERGEQVVPGTPVARLVNTSRLKITAGVPERYASDIRNGTRVQVSFASYGLGTIESKASFVGSVIDRASRTFPVEIEVDNGDRELKPDMIARVMVTRSELDDVLVVPITAVLRDENGTNVFVAERRAGNFVAVRRPVEVGPSYSGQAVILKGLEPGDQLVTAGQTLLTPGDALEIVSTDVPGAVEAEDHPTTLTSGK